MIDKKTTIGFPCILFFIYLVFIFSFVVDSLAEEYSRVKFKHWSDLDHDGLNTRKEELISQALQGHPSVWLCPYSNLVFYSAKHLDIDHIVPLKYAWEHGAEFWDDKKREQFANDPNNLLVVSRSQNRQKGAKGYNEWLPQNKAYQDVYKKKFLFICAQYQLKCN